MDNIIIKNAHENNLKGIDLEIPKGKIVLITGVSGSGKSSIIHDVIYKEAQRLFVESMNNESRRLIKSFGNVNVDSIIGLSPSVAVSQKTNSFSSSSTVGTLSEIYDYLRLLMARFGETSIDIKPLKQQRRLFSFNTPYGACPECRGIGMQEFINPKLIIKDENLSLRQGALKITLPNGYTVYSQVTIDVLDKVCNIEGFNVDIPWKNLTQSNKAIILYGSDKIKIPFGKHSLESRMKWTGITAKPREEGYYRGIIPIMEEILKRDRNANILKFVSSQECEHCNGARLNKEALSFYFDGNNIADFSEMDIFQLKDFFSKNNPQFEKSIALNNLAQQILLRCEALIDLGLGYLKNSRKASSLSSGELQRIRLAKISQSELSGLLYIFDEPSVGLHSADQIPLIKLMQRIKSKGNTILLIEHEHNMFQIADYIIEIGPKAGKYGGEIVFQGDYNTFLKSKIPNSITQKYFFKELHNEENIRSYKAEKKSFIELKNVNTNNLKSINATFYLNTLNVVCGVSGSGKSSLIIDTLIPDFERENPKYITSNSKLPKQIITINQKAIGRTPRSNPATYTKVFDKIRALFAKLPAAKEQGLKSSHFSFNTKGGRCEECQGAGYNTVGMHFIGNVEVICDKCGGNRFQENILEIKYKGKNIKEILDFRIEEAVVFFEDIKQIHTMLNTMHKLGLGYLTLGQRATSLSGGEAQRIKLAAEMVKNTKAGSLYIFDEPSTGLHSYDVDIFMHAIDKLIENGHTIIIIEHHTGIIKRAGHIIELGTGSGDNGGNIVFEGSIKNLQKSNTLTAKAINANFNIPEFIEHTVEDDKSQINFYAVNTNNLKNQDISIPKNELSVFTGVSGSGKSSMSYDTIFKTGRDAFFETFPTYLRSRMDNKSDAKFDNFTGLTPCISINHKKSKASLRSTLGTYSGIYDLYRLLYSRISTDINGKICTHESGFFSFNKQSGACEQCNGLGEITLPDSHSYIDNPEKRILDGAISKNKIAKFYVDKNGQYYWTLIRLCEVLNIDINKPWNNLSGKDKSIILYGNKEILLDVEWKYERKNKAGKHSFKGYWQGISNLIFEEYKRKHADHRAANFDSIMKQEPCSECNGNRLNNNVLSYRIEGLNIADLSEKDIATTKIILEGWQNNLSKKNSIIANDILNEILKKLNTLIELDLGFLSINRNLNSLSGGELQRVSIASSLGARMSNITYIFDEPSRALHPKNRLQVLKKIKQLCSLGNTVIAVEHSDEFINNADNIFNFGLGAGAKGGRIEKIGIAKYKSIFKNEAIIRKQIIKSEKVIEIKSAFANNLKNIDLIIPINGITAVKGVSGSGKSSLVRDVIHSSFVTNTPKNCKSISGLNHFDDCTYISSEFAESSSSQNISAYLKIIDNIRKIFASTPKAVADKCKPNFFSNNANAKCLQCNGQGEINVQMDFMSSTHEPCPECNGSGFNSTIDAYKFEGKTIAEVQSLSIDKAYKLFANEDKIASNLNMLIEIGLGYLPLSQKLRDLSLGEVQRLKLAHKIILANKEKTLFLLDEPSKGLSKNDIQPLFNILDKLLTQGHSIIMIEHNPIIINNSDFVIELGPGAGAEGGFHVS